MPSPAPCMFPRKVDRIMAWKKGQSGNLAGQSSEALAGIRHLRRLFAGSVRDITLDDIKSLYRDPKTGAIIRSWFVEYLKILTHYWPDGIIDPEAKPVSKDISIRVEVVGVGGNGSQKQKASTEQLVTSTLKVEG